jgi:hypothetical protein
MHNWGHPIHTNHSTAKSAKLEFRSEMLVFLASLGTLILANCRKTPLSIMSHKEAWYVLAYMTQPF